MLLYIRKYDNEVIIMSEIMEKYQKWLDSPVVDEASKKELQNCDDMEDRFYKDLEFGTGGLRGVLGAGSNRMNIYTVRQAAQGMASYIRDEGEKAMAMGVAISYDPRHYSPEFAMETAKVLAANGIKSYVFDEMRPTPELSFAVRYLKAFAGVMITASHNPSKYNGFKAYGEDGAQLAPEGTAIITKYIRSTDIFTGVKVMDETEAKEKGFISMIGADVDEAFYTAVLNQSITPDVNRAGLKIIFTPFHGTGHIPVKEVLKRAGFSDVTIVPEQAEKDPNFSTVKSPNPEEKEGFTLAIEMAKKSGADIIIGTDPDADRIGVVAKNSKGEYQVFTGNQTGALLAEYILTRKTAQNEIKKGDYLVTTIVSTKIAEKMAKKYDIDYYEVFTGFKFIADVIKKKEDNHEAGNFLFGYEESYGYLSGTYARDKDAVAAALLICELAAYFKDNGMSFAEALENIFKTYGYYNEKTISVVMEGKDGMEKMQTIMEQIAQNPPKELAGKKILAMRDYNTERRTDFSTGETSPLTIGKSSVLYFEMDDGGFFVIRPSGTEPKIKLYFESIGTSEEAVKTSTAAMEDAARKLLS